MISLYVCLFSNGHLKAATGIRCEDLRPDVNWSVLRGTAHEAA